MDELVGIGSSCLAPATIAVDGGGGDRYLLVIYNYWPGVPLRASRWLGFKPRSPLLDQACLSSSETFTASALLPLSIFLMKSVAN